MELSSAFLFLVNKLYFLFNGFLRAVLTAERWAGVSELQARSHSFVGFSSSQTGKEVLTNMKGILGKDCVKYVLLLKENRLKTPEKWPLQQFAPKENASEITALHGSILNYLFEKERGKFQLFDSNLLIPMAISVETPEILPLTPVILRQEPDSALNIETEEDNVFSYDVLEKSSKSFFSFSSSEERNEDSFAFDLTEEESDKFSSDFLLDEEKMVDSLEMAQEFSIQSGVTLDFTQIHPKIKEEKEISMIEKDGKISFLQGSLSFQDYQLAKDIRQASGILDRIFHNIEDICLNYASILRELDAQISDELHFIEFAPSEDENCQKAYKRLQELRVKRRCVKDSMHLADLLVKTMGTELPTKMNYISEKIDYWDKRSYLLRRPDDFQH